ncbi:beta-propeller domain-containing protein [Fredinandcohnia sp. QZ13]|uniref:beta-propeller domain-containing protein n=1 Tax=Fredinandcohnia sp. QZ13 TaxID=3073144 RepID=UPI0028531AA7|nr:beta-propeller domain-containing protein [Fredinandcohnia sp. QZ13]MDR4889353.1 beta-propeller domain-containing protein [Fredinandcohnia sp. QZ13]
MKKRWIVFLATVIVITTMTAIFTTSKPAVVSQVDPEIQPVTKEKLTEIFRDAIKEEKRNQRFRFFARDTAQQEMSVSTESAAGDSAVKGGSEHSETNTQVQGVDEADIVKTDGEYIYQLIDGKLNIIKAVPANVMQLITTIPYSHSFSPNQMFLYEDKLVVIGHTFHDSTPDKNQNQRSMIYPPRHFEATTAIVYDIQDPKNPEEIRRVEVDGNHVTSRRIDNYIYLVANHYPNYWIMEDTREEDIDLRPRFSDSATSEESSLVPYEKIQYIPGSKETNFTLIAAFDLNTPDKEASITSYLGSGNLMYMSKENIYIAVANYYAIPFREGGSDSPDTNVYKFTVEGDKVEFHSSTEVPGTILNQFSMDEFNGSFRVATTKGDTWNNSKPSSNNLFIYDENLQQIGSLSDLARGERIYSARFMGERIYIVTFKQVDPLFVIDASNPKAPKVLGELKIPGFSNYLHPYDENHVIGFGQDTKVVADNKTSNSEPMVYTDGVKISLFDIRDVNNPKEKFTEIIGGRGTYSPLNYDHKALLFNKEKGIFAFPITVYQNLEGKMYEQKFEFQGAYVYDIHLEGIDLKAKLSHDTGPYETWEGEIQRLLTIGDTLYAISPTMISAYDIKNYNQTGEVSLR